MFGSRRRRRVVIGTEGVGRGGRGGRKKDSRSDGRRNRRSDAASAANRNVAGGERGRNKGRRVLRALLGLVYQRVGILDVTWEPRDKAEAQVVLDADKAMVVTVPGGEKGLDDLVGLPTSH